MENKDIDMQIQEDLWGTCIDCGLPYDVCNCSVELDIDEDDFDYSPREHWSMNIEIDGNSVLHMSDHGLGGVDNISDYNETIKIIAERLLGFIGA
ncbi:MAG: hypothetical protein WA061_02800 [Microgenomates group bacterium]